MDGFDQVNDPNHPLHNRWPWAKGAVDALVDTVTTKDHGGFPCTFARRTIKHKTSYFVFADSAESASDRAMIRDSLADYLEHWKTVPKAEEHLHVLLILFAPEEETPPLSSHHDTFWSLMEDWRREDPARWPEHTPTDPDAPYWSMCFAGIQLFVNLSSPAHLNRLSRNLGPSMVLVTQPRQSFDIVSGANAQGDRLRAAIRRRIDRFDRVPAPVCLGTYGKGELEWPQYALQDRVEDDDPALRAGCPLGFSSRDRSQK